MDTLPNNIILKFNPDTLDCVRQAYGLDNPARIEEAINILEEWVKKQNHFTQKIFERRYLERAIIIGKGSIERAKSHIDSICTFRTLLPKYFVNLSPRYHLSAILHYVWVVPLPNLTKDHLRVWILKMNSSNIKPGDHLAICRWIITTSEYSRRYDYFKGMILLYDFTNVNLLEIVSKINISESRELMAILLRGFGARLKQIHIVNESQLLELMVQFCKQTVSQKIVSRIKFHHDFKSINEYVDSSILPVEYGGKERSINTLKDEWIDVLSSENHIEYLKKMNQAKTDEKNRLEETFNSMYMGTPGSFRHLVVD